MSMPSATGEPTGPQKKPIANGVEIVDFSRAKQESNRYRQYVQSGLLAGFSADLERNQLLADLWGEIARLRDSLPQTEDGVVITPDTVTYCDHGFPHQWDMRDKHGKTVAEHREKQYSTRQAARSSRDAN